MAGVRGAPTPKHLSFQLLNSSQLLRIAQQVLLVPLNAAISTIVVNFKGVSPLTLLGPLDIGILTTNIDMLVILQPLNQRMIAILTKLGDFDIDNSSLSFSQLFVLFLHIFDRLFLVNLFYDLRFHLRKQCFLNILSFLFISLHR